MKFSLYRAGRALDLDGDLLGRRAFESPDRDCLQFRIARGIELLQQSVERLLQRGDFRGRRFAADHRYRIELPPPAEEIKLLAELRDRFDARLIRVVASDISENLRD